MNGRVNVGFCYYYIMGLLICDEYFVVLLRLLWVKCAGMYSNVHVLRISRVYWNQFSSQTEADGGVRSFSIYSMINSVQIC